MSHAWGRASLSALPVPEAPILDTQSQWQAVRIITTRRAHRCYFNGALKVIKEIGLTRASHAALSMRPAARWAARCRMRRERRPIKDFKPQKSPLMSKSFVHELAGRSVGPGLGAPLVEVAHDLHLVDETVGEEPGEDHASEQPLRVQQTRGTPKQRRIDMCLKPQIGHNIGLQAPISELGIRSGCTHQSA